MFLEDNHMDFVKMEGLSNDFIITHGLSDKTLQSAIQNAPLLCDRRKGIGADGIVFILPSQSVDADFRMQIINSDGSEAEMCGNGIRCFALYVKKFGLLKKKQLSIETGAGIIKTKIVDNLVTVNMGKPILDADRIPTTQEGGVVIGKTITIKNKEFQVTAVSMGNPHAIIYDDNLTDNLVLGYGSLIESHPFFPGKVNVEFIKVLSETEIDMRVYERGCGETMACGTGACAAVVSGIINDKHSNSVIVHLLGGDLNISWDEKKDPNVFMTGPANFCFNGKISLD